MNSPHSLPAAEVSTTRVRAAAEALWQIKLENPYTRFASGLEVTSIPSGSHQDAVNDAARATVILDGLRGIDEDMLGETDRLTLGFLRHDLGQVAQSEQAWLHTSPVTPYSSMHFGYCAQHLLAGRTVDSPQALDLLGGLWSDLAKAIQTVVERISVQASHGRRLARPALPAAIASWTQMRDHLVGMLDRSRASTGGAWASRWADTAEKLRQQELLPALDAVISALADPRYGEQAPEAAGLMHQPGGEAEYRRLLLTHLTVPDEPERIHAVGLSEVERLAEGMREVRGRLGFRGSEAEFHARLKVDSRVIANSADDVAQRYLSAMRRLEPLLSDWFHGQPRSPYGVERLAPEQEAGMTYGYYDKPRAIGERGVYRYNASNLENRSQLQVAALIYHELAPGHHFHIARQMELEHLPTLRRQGLELSVFNEGWAEYASGLAGEMGLYDDPYDLYGRLVHERFTAQRLVVDTGLNAMGWSLEQARNYMREHTMEGEAQIASETLRYATDLPAQALAYRLGYLWFTELRKDTQVRRGPGFDVRDFHEAVLSEGALPLPLLREHLERVLP